MHRKTFYRALSLWVVCALTVSPLLAETSARLNTVNTASRWAAVAGTPEQSWVYASQGFDQAPGDDVVSPPIVPQPRKAVLQRPSADLVVGTPGKHRLSEPDSPLTSDGKAAPQGSGWRMLWGLGGAAAGAGLGFLIGGPIGAAIGGVIGGLLGFIFGK
ncbi:MAG: hypothetical protein A2X36_12670 [Elusimicrobia bacterium GWA2_69_24]|nr:MAG: hypothetical protein A2X36_12670 [Elusimicrobia bacterium GWA2_69_24]HBL17453.1 hypothetical protein [Elusimicrobiota bacterium]